MNVFSAPIVNRESYWDSLKFILILCVVFGHFLELNNPVGTINRAIFNFIYLFHMPLFVFVSGRFSQMREKTKYRKSILRLLETLIIYQLAAIFLFGEFSLGWLAGPWFHLWYLLSLIFWRLVIYFTPKKYLNNRNCIIFFSIVVSLIAGFIPLGKFMSFQRTFAFLPFFIIGYYSIDYDIMKLIKRMNPILAFCCLLFIILVVYRFFNCDMSKVLTGAYPYYEGGFDLAILGLLYRLCFIVTSLLIGILVMRLIPDKPIISKLGQGTFFVYIFHIFIRYILSDLITEYGLPDSGLCLFCYSFLIALLLASMSNTFFCRFLLNPISCFLQLKNSHSGSNKND